jgi:hypothetical protein
LVGVWSGPCILAAIDLDGMRTMTTPSTPTASDGRQGNRAAALAGAALLAISGCEATRPWLCQREAIRATLRAPLVSGEDAVNDTLAGNFEADDDENPELDAIEAAIDGRALPARGVSMWLQRGLDHTLNLSLWFPTPLRPGDVIPVVATHSADRASWGTIPNPPAGLSVGIRLDAFVAESARGSARVLSVDPLSVDLDVVAAGTGREVRIAGALAVRHVSWTESCFQ